ncbi:MAG TPA: glycoside hydrolase family 3 N-terminal domain-containing protein [Solirubrobacteraceae bacterium]|jgi:beta-N-acetylhexosaminidase|nr:glycoside hydrolase family 3 N-terminal domain-containing protein [Solirubrobacteraceae bacterium]
MTRVGRRGVTMAVVAMVALGLGTLLSVLLSDSKTSPRASAPAPSAASSPAAAPAPGPRSPAAIAARLPAPQLIAQLFVVGVRGTTAPSRGTLRSLRAHGWGGVVLTPANWAGARGTRRLTARLAAGLRSAHRLPLLVGASAGVPGVGIARGTRAAAARRRTAAAGRALRAAGVNLVLGPDADVGTVGAPLEGHAVADTPGSVAKVVGAAVNGYRRSRTIAAVGHFPGQGAAAGDPNSQPAEVGSSMGDLRARDLRPFAAVARTASVVVASNAIYAAFDGATPAVLLPQAINALLRRSLGFRGVVMSDDLTSASITNHTDVGSTAVAALHAGADLLYLPGTGAQNRAYAAVLSAWQHGQVSTALLRQAATPVLALKRAYGLLH